MEKNKILTSLVLSTSLVLGNPVLGEDIENNKIETSVKTRDIIDKNNSDSDMLNSLFILKDIFGKKADKIDEIVKSLSKKGNSKLHLMSQHNFLKIIEIVYSENSDIRKFRAEKNISNEDFNYILKDNVKTLEGKIDELFSVMFNDREVSRGLTYMKYIEKYNDYDNSNFIKNGFSLDNYLLSYENNKLKEVILELEKISGRNNKIDFIDNMGKKSVEILRYSEDRSKFSERDIEFINYLMEIIQKKLKERFETSGNSGYSNLV